MAGRMLRPMAGAVCHLLLWSCWVSAQAGPASGAPEVGEQPPLKPSESALPRIEEGMPIYHLIGEDGTLWPVPGGWKLDEFERLWKLQEKLAQPDQRPRYVLQQMSAAGMARGKHAELTIKFRVLVREDGWVRVPLHLDRAILREPAEYKGPGEGFVHFEDGGGGHVGWIRGQSELPHQFTLKMLVPLAKVGSKTRLRFLAPRATVSELKLNVPVAKAVGEISGGAELLPSSKANTGATEFTVLGLGGDFELTWQKPSGRIGEQPAVLEAEGTVLARIDRWGVNAEATLKVRGSGDPFNRFRVRLPPGAKLVPGNPIGSTEYTVAAVEDGETGAAERRLVEVRLAENTSGPVEVRLATRRPHDLDEPEEGLELAGFEVLGAARQWGHIDVAAAGDWQVLWGSSRGVRQVEPLRSEDVIAGFDYYAQSYSLTARLVPKKTRISVEPEYRLLVDPNAVQLKATLNYRIRGAKAFELDVAMPSGWESIEVEPESLVAVDGIAVTDGNLLSIPLLPPWTGEIELQVSARWPIPEGTNSLVVPLPQPKADSAAPATVVVVPADNVELIPDHESMRGLIRQQVGPPMDLPGREQGRLDYRIEAAKAVSGADFAVFAADFLVHQQRIAVDVTSRLSLDEQGGEVQQTLAYTIEYEPTDHLTIEVPRSLAESEGLEFQYQGQPLTPAAKSGGGDQQDALGPVRMQIDLPEACIGLCELEVRYSLPLPRLVPNKPVLAPVPLVMPSQRNLSSNRLYVTTAPEIKARLFQGSQIVWEKEIQPSGLQRGLQLSTDQPTEPVKLEAELEDEEGATVVERAWVQTWLTHSARQDRAVFSFTSNQKELPLVVPAGAAGEQIQILLDGKRVPLPVNDGQTADDGSLVIALSSDMKHRRHLLELRIHFPRWRRSPGRLSVELPRLGRDVWVRRMYWQLVLPQNEHVITTPSGFTNEFTWGWEGYFWGRKPLRDQSDLEAWVGLETSARASREKLVPDGVNCYLFSSMGNVERCTLRTAGRSWIVLGASGAALVAGLLLIYAPVSRHPGTLFVVGVVLLCVGVSYPEPTLLIAQAASLGLALTLLAGLLERSVARRRRGTTFPEGPSAILEKGSTQTQYPAPVAGAPTSTQTAPAIVPPLTSKRSGPDSNT